VHTWNVTRSANVVSVINAGTGAALYGQNTGTGAGINVVSASGTALNVLSSAGSGIYIVSGGNQAIYVAQGKTYLQDLAATTGTFSGALSASNLSGTNTGDQNLSGYALSSAIPAPAASTGLIGMSAVVGSASTFARSDSIRAIDPAIAPAWTGAHTWTMNVAGAPITLTNNGGGNGININTVSGVGIDMYCSNIALRVNFGSTILQSLTATTAAFSGRTSAALAPVTGSTDVVRLLDFGTGISAANLASAYAQTGTNTTAIAANTASINPLATGYKQGPYAPLSALAGYAPFAGVGTANPFTVGPLSATTGFFSGAVGVGGTSASPLASINALGLGGMTATNLSLSGTGSLLQVGSAKSAWDTFIAADVGTGSIGSYTGVNDDLRLDSNLYYSSAAPAGWKYKKAGYGADFELTAGVFIWYTAPSGAAGATAALTQVMSLSNAGILNVTGGLNVSGSAGFSGGNGVNSLTSSGNNFNSPAVVIRGFPSGSQYSYGLTINAGTATSGIDGPLTCNDCLGTTNLLVLRGNGSLYVKGVAVSSDIHLKDNISKITGAVSVIQSLNGVRFDWRNTGERSVGLIAQDVEVMMPELVYPGLNDSKALNYNGIVACLVEAVKEQQLQIEALKARLN
jgi:hypothetical protein